MVGEYRIMKKFIDKSLIILQEFIQWFINNRIKLLFVTITISVFIGGFVYQDQGVQNIAQVFIWINLVLAMMSYKTGIDSPVDVTDHVCVSVNRLTWFMIGLIFIYNGVFTVGTAAVVSFIILTALNNE